MGTPINLDEIKRYEVTEVYAHPDAKVDIILVHGLNGDPRKTWTAKNGVFWPTQLLPVSLKSAKARVLVYGYNADVYTFCSSKSASSDMIHQHAQTLVSNIALERKSEEVSDHPIIWVAHSLGGILVKRALELSNDLTSKNADDNRNIFVSTYGIIFLGTPHTGADPAKWGIILQGMLDTLVPKKVMDSEPHLVKTLKTNNETLQNINLHFLDIYQRFKICMVHEAHKTDLKGTQSFIVDQVSASPLLPDVQYFGIEATHSGMCKFESKNSPGYLNVATTIKGWVQESPRVIDARIEIERRTRQQIMEAQAREMLGIYNSVQFPTPQGSTSHTPDLTKSGISYHSVASIEPETQSVNQSVNDKEPYFIKPFGFRPNSLFVGRESELTEIHKLLFDKNRRANGTSAILIQSMPGGGKTHLAREYVYTHKDDFPGGIFWIRAKALPEIAAGYWDIARKAAIKASNEDLSNPDSQQVTNVVREWLNQRENWLLVLDGIHFDEAQALRNFIPDNPNTSLIYTSTVKFIRDDHQFMNPHVIRLPLLSAREAQNLLLQELGKSEPTQDELLHSMELVRAMGFLPVVIHAVGQRLKGTGEPLSKFARSYLSEPKLRGLGAYIAVVDQLRTLGATEALNLLRIMCFFSQHIPVEMLVLGLKVLDVPVKAPEPVTGRTLNNTFKVLNSFALIDRNEREPSIHSSQSSKGSKNSRDMLSDHVDVVRLHSVVESFFIDTLHAEHNLNLWLERAVNVFCCSYDNAHNCIKQKSNTGLVEDYRLYEIHGNRLQEHITRYIKRYPALESTRSLLATRLELIQAEIEKMTAESSQVILDGTPDAFQTSIFDRTYSSSDTAPVTPAVFDEHSAGVTAWGIDIGRAPEQSPVSVKSIMHDMDHGLRSVNLARTQFPLVEIPDPGYASDMGESITMTAQPSQRTIKQEDTVVSPGEPWQVVENRRPKARLNRNDHRTIKSMKTHRYHDTVGAFRPVGASAVDPRVTRETAEGYLHRNISRPQSRGRMSGQSQAEVSLSHLSQISPPPARGGGQIQDRRSTSNRRSQDGRKLIRGSGSYAAAVAGPTRDNIPSYRDVSRPSSGSMASDVSTSVPPSSFAVDALQRIPMPVPPTSTHHSSPRQPPTPMPPYPRSPSPYVNYQQPYPSSTADLYQLGQQSSYSHENLNLNTDPYHPNIYPRKTGPIPYEIATLSPRKRDLPHDYPQWHSQTYGSGKGSDALRFPSLDFRPGPAREHSDILPLSSAINARPRYFQYAAGPSNRDGYTSQPMSRDPSGQSTSGQGQSGQGGSGSGDRRRPSLASTEPLPQLPSFSPRPPPISQQVAPSNYQVYDADNSYIYNTPSGPVRKSPRLRYARAALITSLEEWSGNESVFPPLSQQSPPHSPPRSRPRSHSQTQPQSRPQSRPHSHNRAFNPTAPSFSPRPSRSASPYVTSRASSPIQQAPYPVGSDSIGGGEEMNRTGSGGVVIRGRMIEFGDYPELVDTIAARERVRGAWAVRENEVSGGRSGVVYDEGLEGLGLRIQH